MKISPLDLILLPYSSCYLCHLSFLQEWLVVFVFFVPGQWPQLMACLGVFRIGVRVGGYYYACHLYAMSSLFFLRFIEEAESEVVPVWCHCLELRLSHSHHSECRAYDIIDGHFFFFTSPSSLSSAGGVESRFPTTLIKSEIVTWSTSISSSSGLISGS